MPGISVAVMIVIAAFAIERVSGAMFFLCSYLPAWVRFLPDPQLTDDLAEQKGRQRKFKLVSFVIASALAIGIVWTFKIQVLSYLGVESISRELDQLFTVVVLVAGSDQIRELVKGGGTHKAPAAPEPIHVTGSLILNGTGDQRSVP